MLQGSADLDQLTLGSGGGGARSGKIVGVCASVDVDGARVSVYQSPGAFKVEKRSATSANFYVIRMSHNATSDVDANAKPKIALTSKD